MSTCRTCVAIDCEQTNRYKYSLQSEVYPFVLNCPAGFDCQGGGDFFVTFVACDGVSASRYIPLGATAAEYRALVSECVAEVALRSPYCRDGDGNPTTPDQPWSLYWNRPQSCTVYCPDGNPFTYTVPAGRYLAFGELQANQIAEQEACRLAELHKICLGSLPDIICINDVLAARLQASGNFGASGSVKQWVVSSGSLPTGLTIDSSTTTKYNTLVGTATVAGEYTFTIRVIAPDGDSMSKQYTMNVIEIQPTTLPDATIGVAYSQQLTAAGAPSGASVSFSIVSGSLPTGVTMTESGLISGTPTAGVPATFNVLVTVNDHTCEQAFTIELGSPLPFAYYKLDTITGLAGAHKTPDSMPLALDTNNSNATATGVSGIIGNGWQWSGSNGYLAAGTPFVFTNMSFLIRFWAKITNDIPTWAFSIWDGIAAGTAYRFRLYPSFWGMTPRFYALGPSDFVQSSVALDDTWRRVIIYYNHPTTTIGIKIDQNAADETVLTGPFGAVPNRFDCSGVAGGLCNMDELGFWKGTDAEWTSADFTYDWNSGAGRTYP